MPAPNDRKTQMLDLVRRWRDSGRSARVFAQEQGVTPWTLYYWRERLTQGTAKDSSNAEVVPTPAARARPCPAQWRGPRQRPGDQLCQWGSDPRPFDDRGGHAPPHHPDRAPHGLTLSPALRIYLATGATDLRCSIDGLAAVVRARFELEPTSGHLFLFRNRRGDRVKILVWDTGGFWVLYKRLERGTFAWPAADDEARVEMRSRDLLLLLSGIDLAQTRRRRWYERVA